jgi:RHS repeat-associated protein
MYSIFFKMNRNRCLPLAILLSVVGASLTFADQGPGWFAAPKSVVAARTMPANSKLQRTKLLLAKSSVVARTVAATATVSTLPVAQEIRDLAKTLGNDPLAMFNWVRNHVDYVHYRGAKKGSLTTLVELSGNDCDQSLLLRDLLTAAGIPAILNYGTTWIPYQSSNGVDIRHWLGLPNAAYKNVDAENLLLNRGTKPSEAFKNFSDFSLNRIWVQATINNQTVQMDPSFKKYEQVTGMNLAAACGYQQAVAMGQLGGQQGDSYNSLTNANESALQVYLMNRTADLVQTFKQSANIGKNPLEVTGGWRLQEWTAQSLDEAFPLGIYAPLVQWETPPSDFQATIRLRLGTNPQGGQYTLERTMTMSELAGKRLTMEFITSGVTTKAQLWLDDTLWGEEPAFVSDATLNLEIQISHPTDSEKDENGQPILNPDGSMQYPLDQKFQQSYKRNVTVNGMPNNTAIYALVHGFDVSRESLRRRERMLENYQAAGKADRSREVVGETLNIIGQQWYLQTQEVDTTLAVLTGCAGQTHHRIGRVAQEEGTYIDVMGQRSGTTSRTQDYIAQGTQFTTSTFYFSAMEHGVLSQLQNTSAASTVSLISKANALGGKVFVIKDNAAFTAILSQLSGYSAANKTAFQTKISQGATVVCPANADLKLNQSDVWHGAGYVHASPSEIGMIISGGYQGGFSVNKLPVSIAPVAKSTFTAPAKITSTPSSLPRSVSYDPVDLQTGNFLISGRPDLAVGNTLALVRSYDGARKSQDVAGAGYGWTHSGNLLLTERTSVESALGKRSPTDMAAMLVSAVTVLDLFQNRDTGTDYQKKWIGSLLVAKWAVDQLKNNSVTVQLPDKTLEFIRQPDGSFTPPPGAQDTLTKDLSNQYSITPRNGSTTVFEPVVPAATGQYRIKSTTDLWSRTQAYSYDAASGKLSTITDPFGRSLSLTYQNGRLSALTDSTGRSVSYSYDSAGNLSKFTDAEGKADQFIYDGLHRITETRDPSGRIIVKNVYNDQGRVAEQYNQGLTDRVYYYNYAVGVTSEKDPTGAVTQHLFDTLNRDIGKINAQGQRLLITYDTNNRKISETSPLGRTSRWVYDINDNLLSSTDPTGATTTYGYDPQNRVTSITDPLSQASTMSYNTKHQVVTATDALSKTTSNTYDSTTGYLTSSTNPAGHITSFLYDGYGQMIRTILPDLSVMEQSTTARGDVSWVTDARGIRTDFTYNARRERTSTSQGGRVTQTAYDANRMPWRTTNPRNFASSSTYSATEKPLVVTGPDGAKLATTYDSRDLLKSTVGPMGETASVAYDPLSRPQITTDPLGRAVTQSYDSDGMPTLTQAPLARNSSVAYQVGIGLPRLTTQTNPLGHTTKTEVDAAGQKRFVTNRRGQVFEMRYDALGRVLKTIQPGGRTLTAAYGWNATGRTSFVTEPSGQTTALQYDKRDRLITRTGPDATTSYTYDANGNLLTTTEGAAVLTRTYETTRDAVSRYTNAAGDQISYTYDANGNLSTLVYPGGKTVSYNYDSNDRLVKVTDWAGRITRYGYDLSGRQVWLQRPNGTLRRMAYDAAGQQTLFTEVSKNGTAIASQSWSFDAGGRAVKRTRNPAAAVFSTPAYAATYAADNRLTTLTSGGGVSATVTSDADGNITNVPLWEPTRSWQSGRPLSWDARNRLTSLTTSAGYLTYRYDAEGNLINRMQNGLSTQSNRYTVNPAKLSQQLIEHRPDGSKIFYVYGSGLLYEEAFNASSVSQGTRSYHFDQVGSTLALSNDVGVVTGRLEYTAYGVTSFISGVVDTKFRYNGQYGVQTDLTTGLLQMRARWYSPSIGRFLSEDPIGFSGGMNWYAYADGNPISKSDPFGFAAAQNDFWGQVGDKINALGESLFCATQDLHGATAAGTDRIIDGFFGGGSTVLGHVEPLKSMGSYQPGSMGDRGGDFMATYATAVGFVAGARGAFSGGAAAEGGGMVRVTSWAESGVTADLNPGRWVQLGEATPRNFWKTGLPGPKGTFTNEFPFLKFERSKVPFSNSISDSVPASSLEWPSGADKFRGGFGQRILTGKKK